MPIGAEYGLLPPGKSFGTPFTAAGTRRRARLPRAERAATSRRIAAEHGAGEATVMTGVRHLKMSARYLH